MKKSRIFIAIQIAIALAAGVRAQVSSAGTLSATNTALNPVAGAVPSTTTTISFSANLWTSHPNPSTVSGGTAVSAGGSANVGIGASATVLTNGSTRGTITGGAFGTRTLDVHFASSSGTYNAATITILGPTLNNYGLDGATNFSWIVRTDSGNEQWSGTGEATVSIPSGSYRRHFYVFITPTYYYEYGDVMAEINF
jgi:hypothetical protein